MIAEVCLSFGIFSRFLYLEVTWVWTDRCSYIYGRKQDELFPKIVVIMRFLMFHLAFDLLKMINKSLHMNVSVNHFFSLFHSFFGCVCLCHRERGIKRRQQKQLTAPTPTSARKSSLAHSTLGKHRRASINELQTMAIWSTRSVQRRWVGLHRLDLYTHIRTYYYYYLLKACRCV